MEFEAQQKLQMQTVAAAIWAFISNDQALKNIPTVPIIIGALASIAGLALNVIADAEPHERKDAQAYLIAKFQDIINKMTVESEKILNGERTESNN